MQIIINEINKQLLEHDGKSAKRLFHGRGKTFPGHEHLCIDFFPPSILITAYSELSETFLSHFTTKLQMAMPDAESILIQKRYYKEGPIEPLVGEIPDNPIFAENSLQFQLNFKSGRNIGMFLDMRSGRDEISQIAKGKAILNLFAYTCSFSVVAINAGAKSVVNIDMKSGPLSIGRSNHRLNNLNDSNVKYLAHNIFKSFNKLANLGPYDLIIVDPPYRQENAFVTERDYPKLIKQLPRMLSKGGKVMACLNTPFLGHTYLNDIFSVYAPNLNLEKYLSGTPEFPDINQDSSLKIHLYHS